MSTQTKIFSVLVILSALLLVAAQCASQAAQDAEGRESGNAAAEEEHEREEEHKEEREHEDEHEHVAEVVELAPVSLGANEKLKVVATTNIIGDMVGNVGGDLIELTTMLPIGADPHNFSPAPKDAAAVADAHVVFINGLNLETFLQKLIENSGGKATVVAVSANVAAREFAEEPAGGHAEEEAHEGEEAEEHAHEGVDPHIWVTPANAVIMVENIARALSQLDPAHADMYQTNAQNYQTQLAQLDQWVKQQIENVPAENRKLVSDHDTFGYFADRYGLELIGAVIPNFSTNAEPSAQEVARLQQTIADYGVKAIFVGSTVNPVLAERMAEDTGVQLVPLYTGSLGQPGSGAETYLDYIRYNTTAIVQALK